MTKGTRFFLVMRSIQKWWDDFFFKPTSPATMGIFRIVFGFVIFLSLLGKYPHRVLFYGEQGLVSQETMFHFFPKNLSWLYFMWVPTDDPALKFYFLFFMFFTLLFIIGLFTRVSAVIVFLGLITLSNRNFYVDNAGDDLMRINSFFIMFSQVGTAYSVDKWWRVKRGLETWELKPSAPWVQRMLQLQLAYLYLDTAVLKLFGPSWIDGTAMYYALNYIELRRFNFKYLFYYLWQIKLATYMVLVGEFSLATLVWIRKLRYPILAVGACLHLGINLTMQFPIFQYVMIASLITFVYPEDMEKAVARLLHAVAVHKRVRG